MSQSLCIEFERFSARAAHASLTPLVIRHQADPPTLPAAQLLRVRRRSVRGGGISLSVVECIHHNGQLRSNGASVELAPWRWHCSIQVAAAVRQVVVVVIAVITIRHHLSGARQVIVRVS